MEPFLSAPGPWPASEPDPQPRLRKDLETLGFRLLGGQFLVSAGVGEELAGDYAPEHREQFTDQAERPAQILAAPDGTAFVRLDAIWDNAELLLTTMLPDQRLVTTVKSWQVDPPWPAKLQGSYDRTTDRRREQELFYGDAHSLRIVDGDAAALWAAHRTHVAELAEPGAPIPRHTDLDDAVVLHQTSQELRNLRHNRGVHLAWALSALPLVALVVALIVLRAPVLVVQLTGLVGLLLVIFVLHKQVWLRVRHWRWLGRR